MNYKIILLILLFPVFAFAQTARVDSLANNVLNDLIDTWTYGVDSSNDAVDLSVFNKYKTLFELDAKVADDFNVNYEYNYNLRSETVTGTYKIDEAQKDFDVYAHDVALQVKYLTITLDKDFIMDSNFSDPQNITYKIKRTVTFQKAQRFVINDPEKYVDGVIKTRSKTEFDNANDRNNRDDNLMNKLTEAQDQAYQFRSTVTLLITMRLVNDTVKIKSIKDLEVNIVCTNDNDLDAVLYPDDVDTTKAGDFTASGKPDYDLDGIPDMDDNCRYVYGIASNKGCPASYFNSRKAIDAYLGFQFSSVKINLPELNKLGYRDGSGSDAVDVLQSNKGTLKNPGTVANLFLGGNFSYFFGHKRKSTGVSAGFTLTQFSAAYNVTDPIVYTFKSSDGNNLYRRRVTICTGSKEDIHYTVINLPVLINYRKKMGDKWYFQIGVGPSLTLFHNNSVYKDSIDFEGLYQVDPNSNEITYTDHFDNNSTWNVFITNDSINSQSTNPGAIQVFEALYGSDNHYDFANKKVYRDTQKNLNRTTIAINAKIDACYKIPRQENMYFKLGVHFVYAPLSENSKKYQPIDKTSDDYNSLYNSKAKSNYSAYGINAGFVLNF